MQTLLTEEVARFNIDIVALSETHLSGEKKIKEVRSGFTFFWKGKEEGERQILEVLLLLDPSL